jgi:hypothetical protein
LLPILSPPLRRRRLGHALLIALFTHRLPRTPALLCLRLLFCPRLQPSLPQKALDLRAVFELQLDLPDEADETAREGRDINRLCAGYVGSVVEEVSWNLFVAHICLLAFATLPQLFKGRGRGSGIKCF